MDDRVREAFGQVRAGEALKERTRAALRGHRAGFAPRWRALAAAACLALLVLGSGWLYLTPTARISMDINPSLELGVNRFDRVVEVRAYNPDGQELADSLRLRFSGYAQAVEEILRSEQVAALLERDEVMEITVAESGGDQAKRLLAGLESCAAGHRNTYCYTVDTHSAHEAHRLGLSCGKYRAFLEVQKVYPAITPEEIQGMTMREIRALLSSAQTGEEALSPPGSGGHGGHHGHHGGWD